MPTPLWINCDYYIKLSCFVTNTLFGRSCLKNLINIFEKTRAKVFAIKFNDLKYDKNRQFKVILSDFVSHSVNKTFFLETMTSTERYGKEYSRLRRLTSNLDVQQNSVSFGLNVYFPNGNWDTRQLAIIFYSPRTHMMYAPIQSIQSIENMIINSRNDISKFISSKRNYNSTSISWDLDRDGINYTNK